MYLLLLPFIIYFILFFISLKYRSPYRKFVYIFGQPGSGKSTLMIKYMLKYQKRGWSIYTDMEGVIIPGVRLFPFSALSISAPPPKSAIFLDEVGISMDNRKFKTFDDGLRDFLKKHRHYKVVIFANSQSYDIDKKARDVVSDMILQTSILNIIGLSRPIIKKIALVEASAQGESRIADNLKFASPLSWRLTWLPRYFRYFDSFQAENRPALPFNEVENDKLPPRKALRMLRRSFNRSNVSEQDIPIIEQEKKEPTNL